MDKEAQSKSILNYSPKGHLTKSYLSWRSPLYKELLKKIKHTDDMFRDIVYTQKKILKNMKKDKGDLAAGTFSQRVAAMMYQQDMLAKTVDYFKSKIVEIINEDDKMQELGISVNEKDFKDLGYFINCSIGRRPEVNPNQPVKEVDMEEEWEKSRPSIWRRWLTQYFGRGWKGHGFGTGESTPALEGFPKKKSETENDIVKEAFIASWLWGMTPSGRKFKKSFNDTYNAMSNMFNANINLLKVLDELERAGDVQEYWKRISGDKTSFRNIMEKYSNNSKFLDDWRTFEQYLPKKENVKSVTNEAVEAGIINDEPAAAKEDLPEKIESEPADEDKTEEEKEEEKKLKQTMISDDSNLPDKIDIHGIIFTKVPKFASRYVTDDGKILFEDTASSTGGYDKERNFYMLSNKGHYKFIGNETEFIRIVDRYELGDGKYVEELVEKNSEPTSKSDDSESQFTFKGITFIYDITGNFVSEDDNYLYHPDSDKYYLLDLDKKKYTLLGDKEIFYSYLKDKDIESSEDDNVESTSSDDKPDKEENNPVNKNIEKEEKAEDLPEKININGVDFHKGNSSNPIYSTLDYRLYYDPKTENISFSDPEEGKVEIGDDFAFSDFLDTCKEKYGYTPPMKGLEQSFYSNKIYFSYNGNIRMYRGDLGDYFFAYDPETELFKIFDVDNNKWIIIGNEEAFNKHINEKTKTDTGVKNLTAISSLWNKACQIVKEKGAPNLEKAMADTLSEIIEDTVYDITIYNGYFANIYNGNIKTMIPLQVYGFIKNDKIVDYYDFEMKNKESLGAWIMVAPAMINGRDVIKGKIIIEEYQGSSLEENEQTNLSSEEGREGTGRNLYEGTKRNLDELQQEYAVIDAMPEGEEKNKRMEDFKSRYLQVTRQAKQLAHEDFMKRMVKMADRGATEEKIAMFMLKYAEYIDDRDPAYADKLTRIVKRMFDE